MDISVKENVKLIQFHDQNIQEIWGTTKRQNLRIGIETQAKDSESIFDIFNKIREEFP